MVTNAFHVRVRVLLTPIIRSLSFCVCVCVDVCFCTCARAHTHTRRDEINAEICKYNSFYGASDDDAPASADTDSNAVPTLVDKFYSLVTDIYILGWGESFHFAPVSKGERWEDAMRRHEIDIGVCMGTSPGLLISTETNALTHTFHTKVHTSFPQSRRNRRTTNRKSDDSRPSIMRWLFCTCLCVCVSISMMPCTCSPSLSTYL